MKSPQIFDTQATTLPLLRYLVAIAEHQHFGRAAEACSVAQPTLSEQINRWEKRMGVSLCTRSNRGVQLTPQGQVLAAQARAIVAALEQFEASAGPGEPPFFGPIRMGIIMSLGSALLPLIGPLIERRYPQLHWPVVEGLTSPLLADLSQRDIDCVVLARVPEIDPLLPQEPLFNEPFVAALPSTHPLAQQESVSPEELARENLLLLEDGHCLRGQALEICGLSQSAQSGADYRAASLETLHQLVALGHGVTLLPELYALNARHDTRLALRPVSGGQAQRQHVLVWRHNDHRTAGFQALAALMRSVQDHLHQGLRPLSQVAP